MSQNERKYLIKQYPKYMKNFKFNNKKASSPIKKLKYLSHTTTKQNYREKVSTSKNVQHQSQPGGVEIKFSTLRFSILGFAGLDPVWTYTTDQSHPVVVTHVQKTVLFITTESINSNFPQPGHGQTLFFHTMKVAKRNELQTHATTRVNLKCVMLRESRQTPKVMKISSIKYQRITSSNI